MSGLYLLLKRFEQVCKQVKQGEIRQQDSLNSKKSFVLIT